MALRHFAELLKLNPRIPPERQRAWVLSVPAREANLTAQL